MMLASAYTNQTRSDSIKQAQVVLRRTLGLPLTEGDLRALFKRLDKVRLSCSALPRMGPTKHSCGGD